MSARHGEIWPDLARGCKGPYTMRSAASSVGRQHPRAEEASIVSSRPDERTKRSGRRCGPVKRHDAERYVLISLISFAVTVSAVRTFLWLTDYPKTGVGPVHLAHVLWGGLALFAAAILLLVISNRWVLKLAAVLSGVGVGFFIDEVGKFVTTSNNYFTPAAAPIIYAVFMATVFVYVHVRKPASRDPEGEMHRALEQISGVLDGEVDAADVPELTRRLRLVQLSAEDESTRQLAGAMLAYLVAENEAHAAHIPRPRGTLRVAIERLRRSMSGQGTVRLVTFVALAVCGVFQILDVATPFLRHMSDPDAVGVLARTVLEGGPGFLILSGALLVAVRRDRQGLGLAVMSLTFCLMITDLLVFYQEQLKGLVVTGLQSVAILTALALRRLSASDGLAEQEDVIERTPEVAAEVTP
jgi:hypothetical protein